MTYLFFGLKVTSLIIALRFYRNIKLIKHEPKYYFSQIRQLKITFLLLFGLAIFGSLGYHFFPHEQMQNLFTWAEDSEPQISNISIDTENLHGRWQIENGVDIVEYWDDRTFRFNDRKDGKWNISNGILYTKFDNSKTTYEYRISHLADNHYEIIGLEDNEVYRASRIE